MIGYHRTVGCDPGDFRVNPSDWLTKINYQPIMIVSDRNSIRSANECDASGRPFLVFNIICIFGEAQRYKDKFQPELESIALSKSC